MPPTFENTGLHVMTKPVGPICNLDCTYCYYLHKEELYPSGTRWRMPDPTLEEYVRQYVAAQPASAPEITFAWQGGEPTLLGVEFFRRVVELQKKHARKGQRIVNALQTNGVLLDESWCELFREERFLIGLSIDGPAEFHDEYRVDRKGEGTFAAVHAALKLLQRERVEYNALVVVNRHNGDHGRRVYTYLRDNGVRFLQFIPIVERHGIGRHAEEPARAGGAGPVFDIDDREAIASEREADAPRSPSDLVSTRSVLPEQFGRFLIEVFDEWVRRDVGKVFVQIFDQALSAWMDVEPSLCVFRKRCGRALALEHNGDLYSCDHFVEPEYKLGNIHELPIVELANSDRQRAFGDAKEATLPRYCRECSVRFACNGECPKNRFIDTPDGEAGLNYLCAGYKSFFEHVDPLMKRMAAELRAGRPAANVMQAVRTAERTGKNKKRPGPPAKVTAGGPGRNDACPCGSGKKYKHCCMPRTSRRT